MTVEPLEKPVDALQAAHPMEDFDWSTQPEPHASRRKAIMEKYPQVRTLMGHDPMLKYKVLFEVSLQVFLAWCAADLPWWGMVLVAYTIGGIINHSMTLAMHEISHNMAFHNNIFLNRVMGFIANLPLGIPSFVSFKRYHTDHHKYQGEDGIDVDIPTSAEGWVVNSTWKKVVWMFMQPCFYALRPAFVLPKKPTSLEISNWIVQVAFDASIYYFLGPKAMVYLIISTLLGMGMHPLAGHFIAEHYTFIRGQETYSYYGPLNVVSFNVGYHNEHHDFPNIPGSRLPMLRDMAPEFYDSIGCHTSWLKVIYDYVTNPNIGPFSRVKRNTLDEETRREVLSGVFEQ